MDSAHSLLAALDRWIVYTQHELLGVAHDLVEVRNETRNTFTLMQGQLDVLTKQMRDTQADINQITERLETQQLLVQEMIQRAQVLSEAEKTMQQTMRELEKSHLEFAASITLLHIFTAGWCDWHPQVWTPVDPHTQALIPLANDLS